MLVGLTVTGSTRSKREAETKDGVHLPGWAELLDGAAGRQPAVRHRDSFLKESVEICLQGSCSAETAASRASWVLHGHLTHRTSYVILQKSRLFLGFMQIGSVKHDAGLDIEPCLFHAKMFHIHSSERGSSGQVMSKWELTLTKPLRRYKTLSPKYYDELPVFNATRRFRFCLRIHAKNSSVAVAFLFLERYLQSRRACAGASDPSRGKSKNQPIPAPANSCLLRPTWPVRCSRVAWMYDSPEAAAVTGISTPSCIYDSIKTLHKDKVVVRAGAPFILHRIFSPPPVIRVDLCNRPLMGAR